MSGDKALSFTKIPESVKCDRMEDSNSKRTKPNKNDLKTCIQKSETSFSITS